jgi:hypothetical protein
VIGAVAIAVLWILTLFSVKRPLADRFMHPSILVLMAGCGAGFLLGTPTILWQYRYLLQSINAYTTSYLDFDRAAWPLLKNIGWFLNYYMRLIAPDRMSMALLAAGAILILVKRDRLLLPFLTVSALFFVSKPINLVAAPHHIILWLPFYGIIAGYAVAQAYDALPNRIPYLNWLKQAALVALVAALGLTMAPGPKIAAANTAVTRQRLQRVAMATDWVHKNTPPNAFVAVSYFCFNSDIFFAWLRALDVPVANDPEDGRRYLIWWGQRSDLQGLSGFACAMPQDLVAIKHRVDQVSPGQGTDPYADAGFERVATFGSEPNEVDIFHFDFTGSAHH